MDPQKMRKDAQFVHKETDSLKTSMEQILRDVSRVQH